MKPEDIAVYTGISQQSKSVLRILRYFALHGTIELAIVPSQKRTSLWVTTSSETFDFSVDVGCKLAIPSSFHRAVD
jgi:hypothetical protein